MLASPNFRIQRVKWKFKSTLQERTVIDRALVSLSDWIFGPSQLTQFTRHKRKLKPICALIGEYEGIRVKFNLVWRCRSTWGGRRRNLTNQQLKSFLACFPQTIVNLHSRMESIFQKGKRILIVRGKCCIISTSPRGGLTSLPSSAPTSPSTKIFGIMHGQHNLHDDQQVSPFL